MTLSWLFPLGAIGLVALGAIVVLHMRHRMPGVLTFPQLAFWPRVPSESRESPRWRKPPITLPFMLQLLAALALVLAFMRPAMPDVAGFIGQRAGAVQHVIVLDGSTSMLARDDNGRMRWDEARAEVEAILGDWQQGDGVTLVIASGDPTWKRAVDEAQLDELRAWLAQLPAPGGEPDQQRLSALINGALLPDLAPRFSLVTDGGISLGDPGVDARTVQVGQPPSPKGNVAIVDTVVTGAAGSDDRSIRATVLHDRSTTETLPWVARSGDSDIATGTVTLGPGELGAIDVNVPEGLAQVTISMVVDDALPEDDQAIVAFGGDALTGLSIILVSDLPGPVQHALEVLPGARVEVYPSTTPGIRQIAASADLVVFDATAPAPDDIPNAPMLLVQPTGIDNAWQVGGVVPDPEIGDVRLDDPVMRDVSLEGVVFGETSVYILSPDVEVIAAGGDGDTTLPLIWRGILNDQPYVAYAFDPARSNIADRVSFPVLVAQTVKSLAGGGARGAVSPGTITTIDVPAGTRTVEVTDPTGHRAVVRVPDAARAVTLPVSAVPGRWSISLLDADEVEIGHGAIIVNAGDRHESRLSRPEIVELPMATAADGSSGGGATDTDALIELWPVLVLAGIAVICLEWWVWLGRSVVTRRLSGGGHA